MSEEDLDLLGKLARLDWLLNIYHISHQRRHGPMGDPHRGQGRILALLKLRPEISQKDLSYLLDMRPQSLGELLAKLERNGYITRVPSETDRRAMDIRLTEKGAKAAEERVDLSEVFDCLNAEEQINFGDYLSRVIASLEERLGGDEGGPGFDWRGGGRGMRPGGPFGRHPERPDRRGFGAPFGAHHGARHGGPWSREDFRAPFGAHHGARHGGPWGQEDRHRHHGAPPPSAPSRGDERPDADDYPPVV
ncbi:MAG: MarR family transcriptional regulator [Anaerolineae bacterium]